MSNFIIQGTQRCRGAFNELWMIFGLVLISLGVALCVNRNLPGKIEHSSLPISKIELGQRVVGINPQMASQTQNQIEPNWSEWKQVRLTFGAGTGSETKAQLLRPSHWVTSTGARPGGQIVIEIEEMGLAGVAAVDSVLDAPQIAEEPGNVVTGVFTHFPSDRLLEIRLANSKSVITCTCEHMLWCENRHGFVSAEDLTRGDTLRSYDQGEISIASIEVSRRLEPVYNLEVHAQHVYHVGKDSVLVHNAKATHAHHPIPMFMGGHEKGQTMYNVSWPVHVFYHLVLHGTLKMEGLPGGFGGKWGGKEYWGKYMTANKGSQTAAFGAALSAAVFVDSACGTSFARYFLLNHQATPLRYEYYP